MSIYEKLISFEEQKFANLLKKMEIVYQVKLVEDQEQSRNPTDSPPEIM